MLKPRDRRDRYPAQYEVIDKMVQKITPEGVEDVLRKNKRSGEHKPMQKVTIAKRLGAWVDRDELAAHVKASDSDEYTDHYEFESQVGYAVDVAAKEAKHVRSPRDFDSRGDWVYWLPEQRQGAIKARKLQKDLDQQVEEWLAENFEEVKVKYSTYHERGGITFTYHERGGITFDISTWRGKEDKPRPHLIVKPMMPSRVGDAWLASVEDAEAYVQAVLEFQKMTADLNYTL